MVVIQHLWLWHSFIGVFAVFGFFVISGYLMTLIMRDSYGYSFFGRRAFVVNRFLRIYPLYWVSILLVALLLVVLGGQSGLDMHRIMRMPSTAVEWFQNLALFYPAWNPADVEPKLLPVSWALAVELFFYLAICAGVSRTLRRTLVWVAISLAFVVFSVADDMPWRERYITFAAGSLPFSLGALIYHLPKLQAASLDRLAGMLFLLLLANAAAWALRDYATWPQVSEIGFYLNLAITAALVYSIASGGRLYITSRKLDRLIGDYSYPIYLFHWPLALAVSVPVFGNISHGLPLFVLTCLAVFVFSWAALRVIDKPVQSLRGRVKTSFKAQPHLSARY